MGRSYPQGKRLQVTLRLIAKHLHSADGVVVLFLKAGAPPAGSLAILTLALPHGVIALKGWIELRSRAAILEEKCYLFGEAHHLSDQSVQRGKKLWEEACVQLCR